MCGDHIYEVRGEENAEKNIKKKVIIIYLLFCKTNGSLVSLTSRLPPGSIHSIIFRRVQSTVPFNLQKNLFITNLTGGSWLLSENTSLS